MRRKKGAAAGEADAFSNGKQTTTIIVSIIINARNIKGWA